ncbi:MAG: asparaginase [Actinobacteria bacterium]|nr:asparaginase [Actinomycetota bacterium]
MTVGSYFCRAATLAESGYEPLAVMARGTLVESVHRGAIVCVDARGRVAGGVGDPEGALLLRSTAKPFQALAVIESGAAEAFSIGQDELAVMCGSHAGRPEHVKVVGRLLERLGCSCEALVCGPLTHMCSGKHAGMIAMALHLGAAIEGYERVEHPVQQEIGKTIARLLDAGGGEGSAGEARAGSQTTFGAAEGRSALAGRDSCGVPIVQTSLRDAAYLYALLACGATDGLARIRDAMLAFPQLVAGEGRLDTNLMKMSDGRVLAKAGAEGIMGLGFPSASGVQGDGLGASGSIIKIADGSARAMPSVVRSCVAACGVELAEDVFTHTRPRSAEAVRGLYPGEIVSLVEPGSLRRPLPASLQGGDTDQAGDLTVAMGRGDEKDVLRFLREEWPSSDEETFGRPLEWVAEPFALLVRRRRRIVGVLRGHFTGRVGSVDELMVGKGQRGTGMGSMLLARFELEAEARACTRIVLRAVKDSQAESFYHDRGYHRECIEWSYEFGFDYVRLSRELGAMNTSGQ